MANRSSSAGQIILGLTAIALIAGLVLLMRNSRDGALDTGPLGISTLAPWLEASEIPARASHPRKHPEREKFALRVVPLYDTDLEAYPWEYGLSDTDESWNSYTSNPKVSNDLKAVTLRDISLDVVEMKLDLIPTVILLPKWRGAMDLLGIAHESALIPLSEINQVTEQLSLEGLRVVRPDPAFTETRTEVGTVTLFHAQVFGDLPRSCREVMTLNDAPMVIYCKRKELPGVFVASDPDLMNNHGLLIGENGDSARALLEKLRGDAEGEIYVDMSSRLLTISERSDERHDYERQGDDFERFFRYPFPVFWLGGLAVLALLIWRGSRRFGARRDESDDGLVLSRDKARSTATDARARLLRLSGSDTAIVADYVEARLRDAARARLGAEAGTPDRLIATLSKRDPDQAKALADTSAQLTNRMTPLAPSARARLLDRFHILLKEIGDPHGPL